MQKWYVQSIDGEVGPIDSGQLKKMAKTGQVSKTTLIRSCDSSRVIEARKIRGLFDAKVQREATESTLASQSVKSGAAKNLATPDDPSPAPEENHGLLEHSAKMVRLHAQIKTIQWTQLPKAKIQLARKARQAKVYPAGWESRTERLDTVATQLN